MSPIAVATEHEQKLEWLRQRKAGIGGSDVASVLGLNKYRSAYDVWVDKRSEEIVEIPMNERMHFGNKLEDVIAEEYIDRTGRKVRRANDIRIHKKFPCLIASLDRIIESDEKNPEEKKRGSGVLEIKTVGAYAYKEWETAVPLNYYCQLMHYLSVTGYKWGAFAILVGGNEWHSFDVFRDEDFINEQNSVLADWWETHVLGGVEPDKNAADWEKIASIGGQKIEGTPDVLSTATDLSVVKGKIKALKAEAEGLEETIKTFMANSEALTGNGTLIATWKTGKGRTTIDSKMLQKKYADVYAEVAKEGPPSRKFLLKIGDEEGAE